MFKKNTAVVGFGIGHFINASTGAAVTTGTPTCKRTLDGTGGACANAAAYNSDGAVWEIDLDAADMNGDVVILSFTLTDCLPIAYTIKTVTGVPDASGHYPADVIEWGGTAVASAYVQANTAQFAGQTITCAAGVTVRADVGAAAAPGSANGMLIGGSNAATTFATLTSTGAFTCGSTVLGNTTMGTLTQTGAVSWGATTFASVAITGAFSVGTTTTLTGAVTASNASNAITGIDVVKWLGTACATPTVAGVPEVDITHVAGVAASLGEAQTGDAYARLGAPVGASISADIAAVKAETVLIVEDTGTTLDTVVDNIYSIVNHADYGNAKLVRSTTPANTLDVSATGEAGIDWANVGSPTTTVGLSGTTVGTVTTLTGHTAQSGDSYAIVNGDHGCVSIQDDIDEVLTRLPDATAGDTGGLLIAGSNAATTFASLTCTGALTVSDGIIVTASTTDRAGMSVTGNGTGAGVKATGGASGHGMHTDGNGLSGVGIYCEGIAGLQANGSTTGIIVNNGIVANITGNITGNLVGTVSTVTTLTGHTAQTGDSYAIVNGDHGLVSIQDDIDAIKLSTDNIPDVAVSGAVVYDDGNGSTTFKTDLSSNSNDFYNGRLCVITSGTMAGFCAVVTDYDGTSKFLTLESGLPDTPPSESTFMLIPNGQSPVTMRTALGMAAADLDTQLDAILEDTAEIGAAGAGLTEAGGTGDHLTALAMAAELAKVPKSDGSSSWNSTALAAIQSECNDALIANNLDHLLLTGDVTLTNIVSDNTVMAHVMAVGADISDYDGTTDSLEGLAGAAAGGPPTAEQIRIEIDNNSTKLAAILEDTGTTMPASITIIDDEIAVIDGIVDEILVDTGTTIPGTITTMQGNVTSILEDTGTTIPATITTIDDELAVVDGNVDSIKATTDKLDTIVEEIP